ncbi:Ig-like domain-containing protein [Xanthomonas campestris pv. phormiicola]|nr:Ig-like domain-containing protein [Xanthomonas campestris pv. phormiicola]
MPDHACPAPARAPRLSWWWLALLLAGSGSAAAQSYPGTLSNTVTVTLPGDTADPDVGNNAAVDSNALAAQADLAVSKTLLTGSPVAAGGAVRYRIVVANSGVSQAGGVVVRDVVPPQLDAVSWTCAAASPASSCALAGGSGNVAVTVNVAVGDSVTIDIAGTAPTLTPATIAANTATFTLPPGLSDPNPGNDSGTVPAIPVQANAIVANDDAGATAIVGASGGVAVANVLGNDSLAGAVATVADVLLSLVTPASNPGVTLDTGTGQVAVAAGTPAGNYTLGYQICETANPGNCDSAVVTVAVAAASVEAVDDSAGPVNGRTGASALIDVLGNDSFNGAPASLAALTLTPSNSGPLTINPDGSVDVAANTPAGSYSASYQICETLNPGNCDSATLTVAVVAGSLDAVDDSAGPVGGRTGASAVLNVLDNDRLNGAAVLAADVLLTPGNSGPLTINADGSVDVAANTPAGSYSASYQICETLNPANCDSATVNVSVVQGVLNAADDTAGPVDGTAGATAVTNVLGNDTLDGVAVTPAQVTLAPASNGPLTIHPDGTVDVAANTPAGSYSASYQICETLNPANCDSATVTVNVGAATIDAVDDVAGPVAGGNGATAVVNVLGNDTLNGVAIVPADIVLTPSNSGPLTINPDGTVDVAANTPVGSYSASYQICEALNPANCDSASVTISVAAATIAANNDSAGPVNGRSGASAVVNVLGNDSVNGAAASLAQVTLAATSNGPLTINADGSVDVAANTPAGSYSAGYRICETLNPANCRSATVTVTVASAALLANDDSAGPITGGTGSSGAVALINVLDNDTLDGASFVPAQATLVPVGGGPLTINADGTLDVAANAAAGSYSLAYRLCETLNPLNCDSATATVVVAAAQIQANDDAGPPVSGVRGGVAVASVLDNDVLNGAVPSTASVLLSVTVPAAHPGITLATGNGRVSVAAGTPAGSYSLGYQLCERSNPGNCDSAQVSVTVAAGALQAADDSAGPINGANGATALVNVLGNDTLDGMAVGTAQVTLTPSNSGPLTINPDGTVDVAAGTPAGSYSAGYQLCEVLNPGNCDSATVTVLVGAASLRANDDSAGPVNGLSGATAVTQVLRNDTLNGVVVSAAQVTLTPSSNGPLTINADGTVDVAANTAAGSYSASYQVCEALNPGNCDSATVTVTVGSGSLDAVDDIAGPVSGTGALAVINVLSNDTLGAAAVSPAQVTLTPSSNGPLTINANGTVDVAANTPAGSYSASYQLCEVLNPGNCDSATVTITVATAAMQALDDSAGPVNGSSGGTAVANVLANDTLDGVPVTPAQVTLTPSNSGPLTINPDGSVDVAANTPAGSYSASYQLCEVLNPSNCDSATVTVTVGNGTLLANDDSAGPVNGSSGGTAVANVLANDTLDGTPVTPAQVTLTPSNSGPLTINPDGSVDVAANTPAGSYSASYQLCEVLNPGNCDSATVTVTVGNGTLLANNDSAGPVDGASGGTAVTNVLANDTLNGTPVTPSQVTLTPNNSGPLTINPDGSVDVAANTAPGSYTASYQLCEVANPSNCDGATVTITVGNGSLQANDDSAGPVDGVAGGTAVTNVLTNDTLNGTPVTPSQVTLTPNNSGPLTINPDGSVDVAANTAPGSYTASYQLCEVANPGNCDGATVTITVGNGSLQANDDSAGPVDGVAGGTAVTNVLTNDTLNGTPVTPSQVILTPNNSGPLTINPDGSVDVAANTAPGSYTASYQLCEVANPGNCDGATVTITVGTGGLQANDDSAGPVDGTAGGIAVINVLANDTLNGVAVNPAQVTLTPSNNGPLTINPDGSVDVAANTAAGSYSASYQLCEIANPGNCDSATVTITITVGNGSLQANDDSAGPVDGVAGGTAVTNVLTNDTLNGTPVTPSQVTLIPNNNGPLTINPDGTVNVAANTAPGSYSASYQLCEIANPGNCDSATVTITITVGNGSLQANDDSAGPVDGTAGGTAVTNVLTNDTLNGTPVTPSQVTLIPNNNGPLTINPDGTVSVAANTAPGSYTASYQLCEIANPGNCDGATVTITVGSGAVLDAVDDSAGPVNGTAGAIAVINVLANDTFNGAPVAAADIVLAPVAAGPLTINADGSLDVAANTAAGSYTLAYRICAASNPARCDNATATVAVVAGIVQAQEDTASVAQNTTVLVWVLTNDFHEGVPADTTMVSLSSVTTPQAGTVQMRGDGSLAYTPALHFSGVDTFSYTVCSSSRPLDCATAAVVVTVAANDIAVVDDRASTVHPQPVSIAVLANDSTTAAPIDPASLSVAVAPGNGEARCAQAACVYTPVADFVGEDRFSYRVCDMSIPERMCAVAQVTVAVAADPVVLRVSKQAAQRSVRIGDLVRYTLTVENVGAVDAVGVALLDTPPPGFSYVHGQLQVGDADGAGALTGTSPLRVAAVDIASGQRATFAYVMRVGAGVGPGIHTNRALMQSADGSQISNLASADVEVVGDPMLDESLIVGSVFDDRNGNGVQDAGELGVPGVRIGSAEGLLMETDAHGRFHLVGIAPAAGRGSNFILKVDAATLPPGTVFTSENPRVRRITPGLPVRFDFGVRLPDAGPPGASLDRGGERGQRQRDAAYPEVELGQALFEPGNAQLRQRYAGTLERIAQLLREAGGGHLQLPLHGAGEALGLQRAQTVHAALAAQLPADVAAQTRVELRDAGSAPPLLTVSDAIGLGEALFEPGGTSLRPQYRPLLEPIAQAINRRGGGVVEIATGRGAQDAALGRRRAQALDAALAQWLQAQVRPRLRVQAAPPSDASADAGRP